MSVCFGSETIIWIAFSPTTINSGHGAEFEGAGRLVITGLHEQLDNPWCIIAFKKIAIDKENYAQAAKIRDSLRLLQDDSKASILAANARFYNTFRKGDLASMQALWSKGDNVCVVHPSVSGISGYDLVMYSWEYVWADYEFPLKIEIKDVQVHVRGDIGYAPKWLRQRVAAGENNLRQMCSRKLMLNVSSVFTMHHKALTCDQNAAFFNAYYDEWLPLIM